MIEMSFFCPSMYIVVYFDVTLRDKNESILSFVIDDRLIHLLFLSFICKRILRNSCSNEIHQFVSEGMPSVRLIFAGGKNRS